MAYSFVAIERRTSRVVALAFIFLVLLYFLSMVSFLGLFQPVLLARDSVLAAGVALFLALWHWLLATRQMVPRLLSILKASAPDPDDEWHRTFRNIVEEVSVATGGTRIDPVVARSFSLNAFAAADFQGRQILGVTEGLLSRLSRRELEAVVAQQAAGLISGACLETTVIVSLAGVQDAALDVLPAPGFFGGMRSSAAGHDVDSESLFLPEVLAFLFRYLARVFLLLWFLSGLLRMFVFREQVFQGDAIAVRLTRDPEGLARALERVRRAWQGAGLGFERIPAIFFLDPSGNSERLPEGFWGWLRATHPPIHQRVALLSAMAGLSAKNMAPLAPPAALAGTAIIPGSVRSGSAASFCCPACGGSLRDEGMQGVRFQRCAQCAGILAGTASVEKILMREPGDLSPKTLRAARGLLAEMRLRRRSPSLMRNVRPLLCPACRPPRPPMLRHFFSLAYPVTVDRCGECGSIWFDPDELEVIRGMVFLQTSGRSR